jgi:hypothetical protein
LSLSSQKYGFGIRDPEKNSFRIPDPGVKKAPDPRSGSATLVSLKKKNLNKDWNVARASPEQEAREWI